MFIYLYYYCTSMSQRCTKYPVTVTGIFLLSQEHSQRDQIYVFKILFNCSHTFTKFSMYIWHTVFLHHCVQVKSLYRMKMVKQFVLFSFTDKCHSTYFALSLVVFTCRQQQRVLVICSMSIWFLFVRVTMPFSMSIEESRMSCISCLFSHIAS